MSNVTRGRHFLPGVLMRITNKFQNSLRAYRSSAANTSCVKTHFIALIVVDSINLSSENSCRKQLDSSVEALSYFKFSIFSGELPCVVNLVISKPSEPNTPIHAVRNTSDSRVCLVAAWNMTNKKQDAKPSFGSMHLLLRTSPSPTCVRASCNVSSSK